jgi:GNAT superfamily N-acetyltransferase
VSETPGFVCEPLAAASAGDLAALFERVGSACFCRYWHFTGDKNAWQARLAFEPGENRRELEEHAARPVLTGVVAKVPGGPLVGWMKLEPARELPKIYEQRVYRGLSGLGPSREGVWTIGCFLVDPGWRRRGVARALVRAGVDLARFAGAKAIEALPRRAEAVGDEELWTGPLLLFEREGFRVIHEQTQYPVLRKPL